MIDATDIPAGGLSRQKLQEIARAAHDKLPDSFGFILIVTPFGDGSDYGPAQYASNVNREDAVKALKTILFRWGINDEWMKDAK